MCVLSINLMLFLIIWRASIWAGSFFLSWPSSHPGSAQEIVRTCGRKNKQAQKNKSHTQERNKFLFVFFVRTTDGKLTIRFTCPKEFLRKVAGLGQFRCIKRTASAQKGIWTFGGFCGQASRIASRFTTFARCKGGGAGTFLTIHYSNYP